MVFMAFNLYQNATKSQNNGPKNGPSLVTRADYLDHIKLYDRQGLEASAQQLLGDYNSVIDQDVKKNVINAQEGEAEKMQGAAIVANGFLRGGLVLDDSNKIRSGYQLLQPYFRKDQQTPGWTAPVEVYQRNPASVGIKHRFDRGILAPEPVHEAPFVQVSTSPQGLYNQIIDTLSARNKTDLVWGFIPGGYQFIDFLVHVTGAQPYFSYWFAAFLLALAVRSAVFPLAQKQLMFSRQMSQLTPRIAEIKKQYSEDQVEQNKRVMELYKEYGINPAAGCLPALVQMPLFLTVYQCMLHYQFEFSKGYFLWINPTTSVASHGIVAANLGQQDYILIVIYGITMTVSSMLTPVTDPTQYKQQRMMGIGMSIMITVFMFIGVVPVVSGFVLYWTFTNLLATAQSYRAYRLPLPPLVKVNAPGGGVYPTNPGGPKGVWMKLMEEAQKAAYESGQTNGSGNKPLPPSSNGQPNSNGKANSNDADSKNGSSKGGGTNGKPAKETGNTPQGKGAGKGSKGDEPGSEPGKDPKYKPKKRA
jgi:YidC/Oxa1 family membrane protein insertase